MANEQKHGGGLLARALLDARMAEPHSGGLGPIASIFAEAPTPPRRGLLNYDSALEGFTALPPIEEVINRPVAETGVITWHGASGAMYETELDPIGASYKPRPGIYIFCVKAPNGFWNPVYVGETDSFKRRLTDELRQHHRWQSIAREGATHICTLHVPGGLALREGIETDLRRQLNPPCNRQ